MMRVKKNDTIVVISGKDKGKRGVVLAVDHDNDLVLVKGVSIVTRHVKPRRQGEVGGIKQEESFIALSKVMPVCASCNKPSRMAITVSEGDQKKARVCHRCKSVV